MRQEYTHDVQYDDFRFDQILDLGPVEFEAAVSAFREFSFVEQQQKAQGRVCSAGSKALSQRNSF